jgi:hypothetical protein
MGGGSNSGDIDAACAFALEYEPPNEDTRSSGNTQEASSSKERVDLGSLRKKSVQVVGDTWSAALLGVPESSYPDFLESSLSIWFCSAPGDFVSRPTPSLHPSTAGPQQLRAAFWQRFFFFFIFFSRLSGGC